LCELGVSQTPGHSIYLTSDKEELKPLLMEVSKLGYGKTQKEVKLIFEAVASGSCNVRRYPMLGFIGFWREDPTTVFRPTQ